MKIRTSLSQVPLTSDAVDAVCKEVSTDLAGLPVDLAFVFFSPHHTESAEFLASMVQERLNPKVLLGCSAESVIGGDQEVEGKPALCLWAACLPGTTLAPFHLQFKQVGESFSVTGWPETMPGEATDPSVLVIGEPFTTPTDMLLEQLSTRFLGAPVIGGMASGGHEPGSNRLLFNGTVVDEGVIGVAITGSTQIRTVVSQGCRPIGERFMITHGEQNIIHELSGKPALDRLREVFALLSPTEQRQAERALHLGIVIDEQKDHFERGDFLIRNLVGADQQTGSFALTDQVREGQTVQFQLRDSSSASEDLNALMTEESTAKGALIFSCNGRGQRFFKKPNHDVTAVRERMGGIAVGGFFAMGEIGPVGGNNFLHSYTASIAFFCEKD